MNSRRWSNLTKIIVLAFLAVLTIVLLVTFRAMIPSTIVAFLLAFVLSYPVNWIQQRTGWGRGSSIAFIYACLFILLLLLPAILIPRITGLVTSLRELLDNLITTLQSGGGPLFEFGGYSLSVNNLMQEMGDLLQNVLIVATRDPASIFRGVTNSFLITIYVLVLNFWLLKDLHRLRRRAIDQIPPDYQGEVRQLGAELAEIWRGFLRGQLALVAAMGFLIWVPLVIVGMPNAGGLALLAGVMEFLPTIGTGISGAIGVTVALFQGSNWTAPNGPINIGFALLVMIIYSIAAQIENIYLVPRLVGGRVKLHPAVAFVGTVAGTIVFGFLGVLLATPVIASARTLLSYVYRKLMDREPFELEGWTPGSVRIRGVVAGRKVETVIFDLDGTLAPLDWCGVELFTQRTAWLDRLLPDARRRELVRDLLSGLERVVSFLVSQLRRFKKEEWLARLEPWIQRLRAFSPGAPQEFLPGAQNTVTRLAYEYPLALVTARTAVETKAFLAAAGLHTNTFSAIVTADDLHHLPPHGEGLQLALQHLQATPTAALVVSDTDGLLAAAAAANMVTVGVLTGLGSHQTLQSADLVVNATEDLLDWL